MTATPQYGLSNIQLELLKLYGNNISDKQLLEIKKILSDYFAQKATELADEFYEENNWNDAKIEELANGHFRTTYNLK